MKGFWSNKRVTVTGGAGFLGQHLVKRLESFGAEGVRTSPAGLQPHDARSLL